MDFRTRFAQFMQGRRGVDTTFYILMGIAMVLAFLNLFFRILVIRLFVYLLVITALWRFFSKDIQKRERENQFVVEKAKLLKQKKELYERSRHDRVHVYKKCPFCKAVLRLPRRVGIHQTVCPKCGKQFAVKVKKL